MPPKPHPFPLALNIGTDIVHLPRIARLVSQPNGYLTRFTRRILHDSEQADFRARFDLPPGSDVPLESRLYPTHRRFHAQGQGQGPGPGPGPGNTAGGGIGGAENAITSNPGISGAGGNPTVPPNQAMQSINTEMARWLAGRFAAKEAARKAAPGGAATVGWKDVIVTRGEGNAETNSNSRILSSLPTGSAAVEDTTTAAAAEDEPGSENGNESEGGGLEIGSGRRRKRFSGRASRSKDSGRPDIVYLDPQGGPGRMAKLSISHDGEYVVATVLAAG